MAEILLTMGPPVIEKGIWPSFLDLMRPYSGVLFCNNINKYHVSWGCSRSSPCGVALYETSLGYYLVSINDYCPNHVPGSGVPPSNIDLIFCPLSLSHLARVKVVVDPLGSEHLPVLLELAAYVSAVPRPSCITIMDACWSEFHERIEGELPRLYEVLWPGALPSVVYDEFIRSILRHLLELGASGRDGWTRRRKL